MSSKTIIGALLILSILGVIIYITYLPEVTFEKTGLWLKPFIEYLEKEYEPNWIDSSELGQYPLSAYVSNIPWISYNKSYCAAICLQMIAYKYGIDKPIEYFNFIMSFTYGANLLTYDSPFFIPGSDPVSGFKQASKYLGFKYHFLVTNDEKLFIDACKYLVSKDIPVILPVDAGKLYGTQYVAPHFELLIGYENDFFYIYEPVSNSSMFIWNATGLKFSIRAVVDANKRMNEIFHEPWRHSLVYFTKEGEPTRDITPLLKRNGELQLGSKYPIGYTGAKAIEALANYTIQGKIGGEVIFGIQLAMISRFDNAKFLRMQFSGNNLVLEAADRLHKAAEIYSEILELAKDGITVRERQQIANLLFQAAEYEEEAGNLLIKAYSEY